MSGKGDPGRKAHPLIWLGGILCTCGVFIIVMEIIRFVNLHNPRNYEPGPLDMYIPDLTGIPFGIFYIITGWLTVTAGKSVHTNQDNAGRRLTAALVLGTLSVLAAFGLVIYTILQIIGLTVTTSEMIAHLLVLGLSVGAVVVVVHSPALRALPTQAVVVHHHHYTGHPEGLSLYFSDHKPPPYPTFTQENPTVEQEKV